MLRRTLTILSLLGLLFSVGLWISYYWCDISWLSKDGRYYVASKAGCLWIEHITQPDYEPIPGSSGFHFMYTGFYNWWTNWLPNYYKDPSTVLSYERWQLPWWMLIGTCSLIFLFSWLPARRRRKRNILGLCVKCGYDLRASEVRCPECGTAFETA